MLLIFFLAVVLVAVMWLAKWGGFTDDLTKLVSALSSWPVMILVLALWMWEPLGRDWKKFRPEVLKWVKSAERIEGSAGGVSIAMERKVNEAVARAVEKTASALGEAAASGTAEPVVEKARAVADLARNPLAFGIVARLCPDSNSRITFAPDAIAVATDEFMKNLRSLKVDQAQLTSTRAVLADGGFITEAEPMIALGHSFPRFKLSAKGRSLCSIVPAYREYSEDFDPLDYR